METQGEEAGAETTGKGDAERRSRQEDVTALDVDKDAAERGMEEEAATRTTTRPNPPLR